MDLISWIKAVWNKLFKKEIKEAFGADILLSSTMENWIAKFYKITSGDPYWNDAEDDIESINFAGYIDDVTAGLVTLDAKIKMPDTPRGKLLQKSADYVLQVLNDKVSEALGNAGLMFKPNGKNVDYVEPGNFAPTDVDSNGNILGCVFQDQREIGDYTYTRLEWHRFEDIDGNHLYRITNYAYKKKTGSLGTKKTASELEDIGKPCELSEVSDWANLEEDIALQNVEKPLFAYFKNPAPNRLDRTSPLGVPIWYNCLKELEDLDVAWGRKRGEVKDSKHITFLPESVIRYADAHNIKLPRMVRGIQMGGSDKENQIHEHVATMLTEQRIKDINSILAMISMKCGFSQGFFVLDEKTGMMTATQVEADDQETIRTIKNIRDALQSCLENLFYALNVMADQYTTLPAEDWQTLKDGMTFDFGNILYNYAEDKESWYRYVNQGYVPAYLYFTKFEGMSEDEAQEMVAEAKTENEPQEGLFGEE